MRANERTFFGGSDSFVTLRHLTIEGTNNQIGRKLAELALERYHRSPADFVANPMYAQARRVYFQRNYPVHWERVRGVADVFGLDPEDDGYDFTALMYNVELPLPTPGCSVVYYPPSTTSDGRGYLSRNYDFSIGTIAEILNVPLPPGARSQGVPVMSEPYLMEWYPEDGGYASLAMHAFDLFSGTLDGINSAGLAVSILADEEAIAQLGPNLEVHLGSQRAIGLHELQVMRLLLDTCATAREAREKLLTVKQYYTFVPCHYIIADKAGDSFIYENSTGRNAQYVIDGRGQPQVITNFQIHKHPTPDQMPRGALSLETNAFWRYQTLENRISNHNRPFTREDLKENNACVNVMRLFEQLRADPTFGSIAANVQARTLWHSLYDQQAGSIEISFYLGEEALADGTRAERRSEYLTFALRT